MVNRIFKNLCYLNCMFIMLTPYGNFGQIMKKKNLMRFLRSLYICPMWGKKIKILMIRLIVKKIALLYFYVNQSVTTAYCTCTFTSISQQPLHIDSHQELTNLRLAAFWRQYHQNVLSYNDLMMFVAKLTTSFLFHDV